MHDLSYFFTQGTQPLDQLSVTSTAFGMTDIVNFIHTVYPVLDEASLAAKQQSKPDPIMALLTNIERPLDREALEKLEAQRAAARIAGNRSAEIGLAMLRLPRNIVATEHKQLVHILDDNQAVVAIAYLISRSANIKPKRKATVLSLLSEEANRLRVPAYFTERIPRIEERVVQLCPDKNPTVTTDFGIFELSLESLFKQYTSDPQVYQKAIVLFASCMAEKGLLPPACQLRDLFV